MSSFHTELVNASAQDEAPQRIYLLPSRTRSSHKRGDSLVYAPMDRLSVQDAQSLHATEAYVSLTRPVTPPSHHRRDGSITLPVHPDEGLLDYYHDDEKSSRSHIV